MNHEELLAEAEMIVRDVPALTTPAELARLDQHAATARDRGDDGYEMLAECIDAQDRCDGDLDLLIAVADVAYVASVLVVA